MRKPPGCEPSTDGSFTEKTEKHEACGFAYTIVRSDGATSGPCVYRGEDVAYKFLVEMLKEERWLKSLLENKKPLVMTREDWQAHMNATECHFCNTSLFKELFMDSMSVHDHDTGSYCSQSHRRCYYEAMKSINFIGPQRQREPKAKIDQWIATNQEPCLSCAEPLLVRNHKDSVKDHCHVTRKKKRGCSQ